MIPGISFGSTYKVSSDYNCFEDFCKFQAYASSFDYSDGVSTELKTQLASKSPYGFIASYTLIAPSNLDSEIETFCANKGIKYIKFKCKAY